MMQTTRGSVAVFRVGLCMVGDRIRLIGLPRPGKHKPSWGAPHYTTAVKHLIYFYEPSQFVCSNGQTKELRTVLHCLILHYFRHF